MNPGRGSVVDEEAVATALSDGQLAGYAADVFEFEDGRDRTDRDRYRNLARSNGANLVHTPYRLRRRGCRKAIEAEAATSILEALPGSGFGCDQRRGILITETWLVAAF